VRKKAAQYFVAVNVHEQEASVRDTLQTSSKADLWRLGALKGTPEYSVGHKAHQIDSLTMPG
jgi:hypothetical protein